MSNVSSAVRQQQQSKSQQAGSLPGHAHDAAPDAVQAPESQRTILAARDVRKNYRKGQNIIPVLRGLDVDIREGEFISIIGQSGCGKSTLLHLLGTLDHPDAGEIYFGGERIDNIASKQRDKLRNETFGLVFQFYHLLPELAALGNVLLPLLIGHGFFGYLSNRQTFRRRAVELLSMVGLGHRLNHKPRELSGGEMQRTAIARALINGPRVLLADEPTGNLDQATADSLFGLLTDMVEQTGIGALIATHNLDLANRMNRIVRLEDGVLA